MGLHQHYSQGYSPQYFIRGPDNQWMGSNYMQTYEQ